MKKKSFADLLVDAKDMAEAAGSKVKVTAAAAGEGIKVTTGEASARLKTTAAAAGEAIKATTSDAGTKIKHAAAVTGEQFSETTGKLVDGAKNTFDKLAKKAPAEEPTKELTQQEADPKVKLDDALRQAVTEYNDAYTTMNDNGNALCVLRTRAVDLIDNIEALINSIANRPKSFDTDIAVIQMDKKEFTDACEFAKAELEAAKKSALGAGAGAAAGAAIVSVAPAAAMWIATTFGTASTGTAISALSGAAATNAALAWLGGGALAAGGGGMSAGTALLAMAGPVGWAVAGATLLTSITLFTVNKVKLGKQKKEEIEAIKTNTNATRIAAAKIQELIDEATELRNRLNGQYNSCMTTFGKDFLSMPEDQQMQLGTLVNNTKAMAASLKKSLE